MTYDDDLADRVRAAIGGRDGLTEKQMFGGLGFMLNGHLALSASSQGGLMVRVDPADTSSLVSEDGVSRFEMRGRSMNGWLHVDASVAQSDEQLDRWVALGLAYAGSLPAK